MLKDIDPRIKELIFADRERQEKTLNLIASENYASKATREACASVLTNKYAEGYPGARYYAGCEFCDRIETLAIQRAKELFKAEYVNVQPHSGTQANMAAYLAFLSPGDTIMAMDLACGGHLSHGSKVSFSGILYNVVTYSVDPKTHLIDLEKIRELALAHRPRMIVCGASAYPRIIDFKKFREVADSVGALLLADIAHIAGLIVGGAHPSPIESCHIITTTTHKTLRGPRGGMIITKEEYGRLIDKAVFPGIQGGPLMHIIASKAVCFKEALSADFKEYSVQITRNAKVLADTLISLGLTLVSGGTDNHLLLVDLSKEGLTGKEAEAMLYGEGIVVNKNAIPYDQKSPSITSGIRLGTPALTTRGMKEAEMERIAYAIDKILRKKVDVKDEVLALTKKFPIPE
ncbi:MAG: serine hydroxymethyltransferase [bacterium]|nr:serine hydroxymethyltransferase [bacterium]